ncbi:MAG: hypothetical protein P1V97_33935 [Planctomycetota bacterium]|nr:hypothetical protein [Planctomycetota bacterium]
MINVKELEELRLAFEAAPGDRALRLRYERALERLSHPAPLPRFDPRENYFLDRGSLEFKSASFPAVFSDFIVDSLLGLSTTDVHVSAWSLNMQRRVVLKILKPGNEWVGGDFSERWASLKSLPEGSLTPLLSWGEIEGLWCFVFPFQDGLSISSQMWNLKQQATGNLRALQKLAYALGQSHDMGIFHGQINERNVLLGEDDSVYLIGYEKCLWAGPEPYDLAKRPLYYGHPENFAPEQWSGELKCDERVDVYQLGLLMYQLISFKKAFPPSANLVSAIQKILEDGPADPRTWNPGLDSSIVEVCFTALKGCDERYQSARDFADALDSLPDYSVPKDLVEGPQVLKPEALDRTRTWFRGLQQALRRSMDEQEEEDITGVGEDE